jgi:L-iditol 2-dehydrogenase
MKALLLRAYDHFEMTDRPRPVPGSGEVLVRIEACGICGSDVHGFDGSSGRRIPPIVMGHEAAGTVAEIGPGVAGFQPGDRITFDSTISCGECPYCLRGESNLCDRRNAFGVSCDDYRRDGAFAEYLTVPQRICYRLPNTLSFAEAAMLEPVSVALHAVAVSQLRGGETALVIGAGMIGLLTLQAARAAGCRRIFIADIDNTRLDLARNLGATEAISSTGAALARTCRELTGGHGVDIVFEAVGRSETVAAAVDCTRKGGAITLIGNIDPEVMLPLQKVVSRQIRLQGTAASCGEYPRAIELLTDGAIRVKPLITAVAPLEDGPSWFQRLHAREPNLMKVVLTPSVEARP